MIHKEFSKLQHVLPVKSNGLRPQLDHIVIYNNFIYGTDINIAIKFPLMNYAEDGDNMGFLNNKVIHKNSLKVIGKAKVCEITKDGFLLDGVLKNFDGEINEKRVITSITNSSFPYPDIDGVLPAINLRDEVGNIGVRYKELMQLSKVFPFLYEDGLNLIFNGKLKPTYVERIIKEEIKDEIAVIMPVMVLE